MENLCPCGSQKSFEACCGPYLSGKSLPPTAEAVMRSRYTAYTRADVPYLMSTALPGPTWIDDPVRTKAWAESIEWKRLEILHTEKGSPADTDGVVEFKAWYKDKGKLQCLHERSVFNQVNGKWMYASWTIPSYSKAPVGRNDDCPCGSGKKYKKCCGA